MKRLALVLLFVAGCDGCGDNDHHPDASVPNDVAADASIDAPMQMGTVTASATVTYLTEAGPVTGPAGNLVLIDSLNTVIQPTSGPNNTLTFANVAPGSYAICDISFSTRHLCIVSSLAMINLDYNQTGRPDAVNGGNTTTLTLTVNGATAATSANEFLDVRALNTAYVEYPVPPATNTPLVQVLSFNGRGMLQAADVLRVTQLVSKTTGGDEYVAAARMGSVTGVTMTNNADTAASVTLGTTLAQTGSASFNLRRSLFNSLAGSPGPGATWLGCEINGWVEKQPYGWKPWTFWYPRSSNMTTDKMLTFSYGNPEPSNTETFEVACSHQLNMTAPGATNAAPVIVYAAAYRPKSELTGDISPTISRPTAIKINGMDASTALTGTTATPTVSWTAPSTGVVNRYVVFVYRLVAAGSNTLATVSGEFATTSTSFKIPPGYIQAGQGYAVTVRAQTIPGYDAAKPFAPILRYELADASTAALTP